MRLIFEIERDLSELAESLGVEVGDFVVTTAYRIEAEAKTLIQHGSPAGRTYRRGAINKAASQRLLSMGFRLSRKSPGRVVAGYNFHRASAPGQPPATDTGNLVNLINAHPTGPASAEVDFNAAYAGLLEMGTGHMAPRPYVGRSIDMALERAMSSL